MEWRRRDSELGRSAVKEPCRRGEEKPPFVDGFSDFLTGLQDLFWQSESHMGRATTSNLLLAWPTTSLCACPPLPTSAVAENLAKSPRQEQTAATHHHLLVHVGQAQVTIGHNVTSKASNHSWPPWFYLPSRDQEFLAFAWPRCHRRCCCRSRHSAGVAPMTEYVEPASCRVYSCCLLPAPPQPWPSSSLRPSIRNCWLRPSWTYQRQADPVPNSSLVQLLSDPKLVWFNTSSIREWFNDLLVLVSSKIRYPTTFRHFRHDGEVNVHIGASKDRF